MYRRKRGKRGLTDGEGCICNDGARLRMGAAGAVAEMEEGASEGGIGGGGTVDDAGEVGRDEEERMVCPG